MSRHRVILIAIYNDRFGLTVTTCVIAVTLLHHRLKTKRRHETNSLIKINFSYFAQSSENRLRMTVRTLSDGRGMILIRS